MMMMMMMMNGDDDADDEDNDYNLTTYSSIWVISTCVGPFVPNIATVPPAVKVTNERVQVRLARVHRWVRSRSVRVHR